MRRKKTIKIFRLFILTCFSTLKFAHASPCTDLDFKNYSDSNKDFREIFVDNTIHGLPTSPVYQRIAQLTATIKAGKQVFRTPYEYGIWGTDEGILIHLPNAETVANAKFSEGVTVKCYYDEAGRSVLTGKFNFIMAEWQR
ncbi:hypothetical protein [Gluconobacter kondonii]|uniref:hypothetical protein n=1 Tax=Gluconobacter kondonii TaxID=941463 RepID=UPI001B8BAF9B|nr:hypothetical protein [Gluconobacter kondonii]MBS1082350.1 hypothetical protein [Gluconobacter kondonii]